MTPSGSESVVMLSFGPRTILSLKACDAVFAGEEESFTWMLKVSCPTAVGVPEIVPVEAKFMPAGSAPDATVNE